MKLLPRTLFLLDSLGALLSAAFLGLVLPRFARIFGVPPATLHVLALLAVALCLYSFTCYRLNPKNWRPFMQAIATANVLYCALTAWLMFDLAGTITPWGVAYFVGEIAIVLTLAGVEFYRSSATRDTETGLQDLGR